MKVSVITVSYNSEKTIESTIQSVLNQDYNNVEYIIIDGQSTDNTLQIINQYSDRIAQVISEKDDGIYDAINKGILTATGDIVGLIHSDDFYAHTRVLSRIVEELNQTQADAVYSDLQYVDRENSEKVFRVWKSGEYTAGKFIKGWMPPHPTFYVKRNVFLKHGLYDLTFRLAADYELMLRYIHKNKITLSYIPETLIKMRVGGASNTSILNRIKANQEDMKAWKVNGLQPSIFTRFLKPLSKLTQFLDS